MQFSTLIRAVGWRGLGFSSAGAVIRGRARWLLLTALLASGGGVLHAMISLAPLFRDGVVLQQGRPVPVWGRADPNAAVVVAFAGQTVAGKADAAGAWSVQLPSVAASNEPRELVVTSGAEKQVIRDVVVGEVWLCSGQSNMEWLVSRSANAASEIAAARHPLIRHLKIKRTVSGTPADTFEGEWETCDPKTVGDFSAVAYFFGRELAGELKVPIGLINSSWGGTPIESWMSLDALKSSSVAPEVFARWQKVVADHPAKVADHERAMAEWRQERSAARASGKPFSRRAPRAPEGPGSRFTPAGLYNGMIAPVVPAAIRGVIWYQGEANAARAEEYARLFPMMIQQWRHDFGQPGLPFYFVQLANFERRGDRTNMEWAFLREAQAGALVLPHTGMAVTIDIGDPGNIHPKNKQEVGRRLARVALADTYGRKGEFAGPQFAGLKREGPAFRVSFTHAAGLHAMGTLTGFEVAGQDRHFHAATARIEGESVIVTAADVTEPVAVRYAWRNAPSASLFNAAGFPAAPFRSDKW